MSNFRERVIDCVQQDRDWFKAHCGRVTASNVWKVMDRLKNGNPSAKRKEFLAQIVAEILTGNAAEHYVSYYMERGREYESFARAAYEVKTGQIVDIVGFVVHPTIERAGCSPDFMVGSNGGEIKCCQNHIHLQNMGALPGLKMIEGVPEDYVPQMDM